MKPLDPLAAISLAEGAETQEKWRKVAEDAYKTGRMANTLAKALAARFSERWRFIDFLGPNGRESAGIVDIFAIRKSGLPPSVAGLRKLDLFDIQLMQVKGGTARLPTESDIARLRLVQQQYSAKRVVLFEWVAGKRAAFSTLEEDSKWAERTPEWLFGKNS